MLPIGNTCMLPIGNIKVKMTMESTEMESRAQRFALRCSSFGGGAASLPRGSRSDSSTTMTCLTSSAIRSNLS